MQFIFGLLVIFALVGFVAGCVLFLKKDKRTEGKRLARNSFIFLAAVVIVGMFFEKNEKTEQLTAQDSEPQSLSDKSEPTIKDNDVAPSAPPKGAINPNFDPAKNMKRITDYLKTEKIQWKASGGNICIADNYCAIDIGATKVEAIGGNIKVWLSNNVSTVNYMTVCSSVLSGLSSLTKGQTQNYVAQAFAEGARGNQAKFKIGEVDMTIKARNDSRLECNFFRMTK